MKDIDSTVQQALLQKYEKQFYFMLFGCGGVMFRRYFMPIFCKGSETVVDRLITANLIKKQAIGRNSVFVLKYAVFKHFNIPNKSIRVTVPMLFHSATVCEMVLDKKCYFHNIDRIDKFISLSNLAYYSPLNSYYILNRIYNYLQNKGETNLHALEWSKTRLWNKIKYIKGCGKGKKVKFPTSSQKYDDLLVLRSNGVYVVDVSADGSTIILNMAIFATTKKSTNIANTIIRTENALADMFGEVNIKIIFDIYSVSAKNPYTEKAVMKKLLSVKGNESKADYYSNNINFRWLPRAVLCFSGIDTRKWL